MSDGPYVTRVETPADRDRRLRFTPKSRSFSAHLVAFSVVNSTFWESASQDPLRPAFALFVSSRQEETPFLANLRKGRKLRVDGLGSGRGDSGWPCEFLKSAGYKVGVQRTAHGSAIEVSLGELYEWKPGMVDPETVRFLLSVEADRLQRENGPLAAGTGGLDALFKVYPRRLPRAAARWLPEGDPSVVYDPTTVLAEGRRFVSALDQRSEVPLPPDPLFGAQVLLAALRKGHAVRDQTTFSYSPGSERGSFYEVGMDRAKRAPGLAFKLSQARLAAWLAEEVTMFDALKRRR